MTNSAIYTVLRYLGNDRKYCRLLMAKHASKNCFKTELGFRDYVVAKVKNEPSFGYVDWKELCEHEIRIWLESKDVCWDKTNKKVVKDE